MLGILFISVLSFNWNFTVPQSSKQAFIDVKGVPDTATYFTAYPIGYFNTAGGYHLVIIQAKRPLGSRDYDFTGTVYFSIYEGNPNGSASIIDPYTMLPTDSVDFGASDSGEKFLFLTSSESEYIAFQVWDTSSERKSSIPAPVYFDTATTNLPDIAAIDGPEITHDSTTVMYEITLEDVNGKVNPTVTGIMDSLHVRVKIIGDDNGSAVIWSLGTSQDTALAVPMISGRGWIWFKDTEIETVQLVTEDIDPLIDFSSDTFEIALVPDDQAWQVIPFTFKGAYTTVGESKIYYLMAMKEDGPDPDNNSTEVIMWPVDILGTSSVQTDPTGWNSLVAGIQSVSVTDTEMDSVFILRNDARGTPYLYPYIPMFCGGFVDTGRATLLRAEIPLIMASGDTYSIDVSSIDNLCNTDTTYTGWYYVNVYNHDYDGSEGILDTLGNPDSVFKLVKGNSHFLLFDSEPETMTIRVECAEGDDPLWKYLGTEISFGEQNIVFTPAGATAYAWNILYTTNYASPGKTIFLTIAAVDSSGNVVPSFNNSPTITLSGNATYEPDPLSLTNGVGVLKVTDTLKEAVEVTVTGGGLDAAVDTIYFMDPDSAAYIIVIDGENMEASVNESLQVNVIVATAQMEVADYYNGWCYVVVIDTTRSDTTSTYLYPDSFEITGGSGTFYIADSEPEYITYMVLDANGKLQGFQGNITFYGTMHPVLYGPHIVNEQDTMDITLVDYYGNQILFTSELGYDSVWYYPVEYGSINGSFFYQSASPTTFVNGFARFLFTDTEAESVDINIGTHNDDLFRGYGYAGSITYTPSGIEKNYRFSFGVSPVVHSGLSISYTIDRYRLIEIEIFDITGRVVYNEKKVVAPGQYSIKVSDVPGGVYFVKYKAGEDRGTLRTILIK